MKNYKVNFPEAEREAVLQIITRSNDVVLNQIEPESAFITIQLEDEEADQLYEDLLYEIDVQLNRTRPAVETNTMGESHSQPDII